MSRSVEIDNGNAKDEVAQAIKNLRSRASAFKSPGLFYRW